MKTRFGEGVQHRSIQLVPGSERWAYQIVHDGNAMLVTAPDCPNEVARRALVMSSYFTMQNTNPGDFLGKGGNAQVYGYNNYAYKQILHDDCDLGSLAVNAAIHTGLEMIPAAERTFDGHLLKGVTMYAGIVPLRYSPDFVPVQAMEQLPGTDADADWFYLDFLDALDEKETLEYAIGRAGMSSHEVGFDNGTHRNFIQDPKAATLTKIDAYIWPAFKTAVDKRILDTLS